LEDDSKQEKDTVFDELISLAEGGRPQEDTVTGVADSVPIMYFVLPRIPPSSAAAAATVNSIVMVVADETHGSRRRRVRWESDRSCRLDV